MDAGHARFIPREFHFNKHDIRAGVVARRGRGIFHFGIVEEFFARQGEWNHPRDPEATIKALAAIGEAAGVSHDDPRACIDHGAMYEAMVAVSRRDGEIHGMDSTPAFIVNEREYSNMPRDKLFGILDEIPENQPDGGN